MVAEGDLAVLHPAVRVERPTSHAEHPTRRRRCKAGQQPHQHEASKNARALYGQPRRRGMEGSDQFDGVEQLGLAARRSRVDKRKGRERPT